MAQENVADGRPFVGRDEEMDLIRATIREPERPWLLWVIAGAGSGKSHLLEQTLGEFTSPHYPNSGLFDFFTDGHRTRDGILVKLAKRFGVYGEVAARRAAYQAALEGGGNDERRRALAQLQDEVVKALQGRFQQAQGGRGLLVLDTVERVIDRSVGRWLFATFLPKLEPHVVVIAAGRPIKNRPDVYKDLGGDHSRLLELGGLDRDAVGRLLEESQPGHFVAADKPDFVEHVYSITTDDKGGQALLVALVAHRMQPDSVPTLGVRLEEPDVRNIQTNNALREKLVQGPLLDESVEGTIVLLLTHADHGFDAATLGAVLSPAQLEVEDEAGIGALLDRLGKLPFVKYHKDDDDDDDDATVTRVHDYFRDVAREEVWRKKQDQDLTVRRGISEKLATYFGAQLKDSAPARYSPTHDRLTLQWLFHKLFAEGEAAYATVWNELDAAWRANRTDHMNDVLEIMSVVDDLTRPPADTEPTVLGSMVRVAQAWSDYSSQNRSRNELAEDMAEMLGDTKLPDTVPSHLILSAHEIAGMALTNTRRTKDAIDALQAALDGYNKLLEDHDDAERGDEAAEASLAEADRLRFHQFSTLANMGFTERARNKYAAAEDHFKELHKLSTKHKNEFWQAVSAYQVGATVRYEGKVEESETWIERGVELSRQLGFDSIIGQSLMVQGRLQRDLGKLDAAEADFAEALRRFEAFEMKQQVAAAYSELGWVATKRGDFARAEERFKDATDIEGELGEATFNTPSLKEKHGRMLLRQAEATDEDDKRRALFDRAEATLREGVATGDDLNRQLYRALCLAALVRLERLRGREDEMRAWQEELADLRDQDDPPPFEWAYAELEKELGHHAFARAQRDGGTLDPKLVLQAGDHYVAKFAYLAQHSHMQFRDELGDLRAWLRALPNPLREDVGRQMRETWSGKTNVADALRKDFDDAVRITAGLL